MIRDERTKALLNPDADALYKYKAEREKNRKMIKMENELENLNRKVEALSKLLENRTEKNNG